MTRLQEVSDASQAETVDHRWEAWQERGHVREKRMRARFRLGIAALVLIAGGASLWLVLGV